MELGRNERTGGYTAHFALDGQRYAADLSFTPDRGPECMVFRANKQFEVTDWHEVYACWFSTVTRDNLVLAVNDFLGERRYDGRYVQS